MLSICIPTMKRWNFLKLTIPEMLKHDIVKEIVICDETGEDIEEIEKSKFGKNTKLRLIKNEKRLGIYRNKRKVGNLATGEWIGILDSDNIFPDIWFEEIESIITKDKEKKTIYGSASFRNVNLETGKDEKPCIEFDGLELNKQTWNTMFNRRKWNFLLNDGNWVLPREAMKELNDIESEKLQAADAIYMLRCWIEGGYRMKYIEGLEYIHTVHGGSSWLETERESTRILNQDWRI